MKNTDLQSLDKYISRTLVEDLYFLMSNKTLFTFTSSIKDQLILSYEK